MPKIGFTHHGPAIIPYAMVISTGVNFNVSIISKLIAILPKVKQNPNVK